VKSLPIFFRFQSNMSRAADALVGAAVGAVIGAVVLTGVATVDRATNLNTVALRPTATTSVAAVPQHTAVISSQPTQRPSTRVQEVVIQSQGTAVYSWAFVAFAAVAGAINGLFLLSQRRVAVASTTGRREALLAGVAAAGLTAGPAFAAYGDKANVFGKPKDTEQYFEASGEGWSVQLPAKYNGSKEQENIEGLVARWEDNFDAVNTFYVAVRNVGKNSVTELGSIDEVRDVIVTPLLGKQTLELPSLSEGGFAPGRFSNASILDQKQETKDGKTFYTYEILTRTADGNEGGRHQLFTLVVSNGKLYIFKGQAGDKRWFKGLERQIRTSLASFRVA
jgi:photosystem II oxygen-evolving enhancer protein 2